MSAPRPLLPALLTVLLSAGNYGFGAGGGLVAQNPGNATSGSGTGNNSVLAARIAALLPTPGQVAQVVKIGSRITSVDLQKRVIEAGGSRKALENVLAVISSGGTPTYDERLNISRAEFGKYLAFQPVILPTDRTLKLPVTRDASRLTFGDTAGLNGVLRGLTIDLHSAELRVPEGFAVYPVAGSASSAADRSIDIRSAYIWNLTPSYNAQTQNGINGKFSLYQLGNGQVLLIYKRTSMLRGVVSEGEMILSYTRP